MSERTRFRPTHFQTINLFCYLGIAVVNVDGELLIQSAFLDDRGKLLSRVTKSRVQFTSRGVEYFLKGREKYYLCDFTPKSPFNRLD